MTELRPLTGTVVLDLSRMLPGAVLARLLVDLGARVIKVEDPGAGDPMRAAPPVVDGIGAGFRALLRGTESVALDLRSAGGQAALRKLAKQADVLVESFRPGTMARWGLGPERLAAGNAGLVTVSLSGFGAGDPGVAHDLNLVAGSGLLALLPAGPDGALPRTQLADVATGMLASTAVLAALLQRHRTHRGMHLDQPLAAGPRPFLAWPLADQGAGGGGWPATVLAGGSAAYAVYPCGDGERLAVGAIEPKFWAAFLGVVGLDGLDGLDPAGPARAAVAARLAERPRAAWLAAMAGLDLPVTPVNGPADVPAETGAWLPAWAPDAAAPVPAVGADTARVLAEFGAEGAEGAA